MNQNILDAVYQLTDDIKQSDDYRRLLEQKTKLEQDPAIGERLAAYQNWQAKYDEVRQYGTHHPDLKRVQLAYRDAREALFSHPDVRTFVQLEKAIQARLDDIARALATTVSDKIKHPDSIGLIQRH